MYNQAQLKTAFLSGFHESTKAFNGEETPLTPDNLQADLDEKFATCLAALDEQAHREAMLTLAREQYQDETIQIDDDAAIIDNSEGTWVGDFVFVRHDQD